MVLISEEELEGRNESLPGYVAPWLEAKVRSLRLLSTLNQWMDGWMDGDGDVKDEGRRKVPLLLSEGRLLAGLPQRRKSIPPSHSISPSEGNQRIDLTTVHQHGPPTLLPVAAAHCRLDIQCCLRSSLELDRCLKCNTRW